MAQGRFANDTGFIGVHFISEFSAAHHCRSGNEGEIIRRFDRAAGARRNGVRWLMMARNLFDLTPSQSGYWEAQTRAVALAAERGLYAEPCLFADAQDVLPNQNDRKALVRDYAQWCLTHVSVIPQLTNEPQFNGFSGPTDPMLLTLADQFAADYGSRDFSIGDPRDYVQAEANGDPLRSLLNTLSQHCNILTLHGERKEDPAEFARWVNHLKGFDDFRGRVRKDVAFWHDEPMGMASVKDVPLPGGNTYRREDRPDALVAAACVAAIIQTGFTTHYISEQDDTIPGLVESGIAADIPQSPDWRFINAALQGSPVTGFTGFDKVRPSTNGHDAWAVGVGKNINGTIAWAAGFVPELMYSSAHVEVWRASR